LCNWGRSLKNKDKSMKEVAKAWFVTDALDKNSVVAVTWWKKSLEISRMTFTQGTTTRWIMLWRMFCSSIQAFCRKGLLCFLLISEMITREQHLFSLPLTSQLQLMKQHRVCAFFYCRLHPSGTTRISKKVGIIWLLNLAFSYKEQLQVMSAFQTKWSDTVLLDEFFGIWTHPKSSLL
jgi:hypothetical protein